MSESPMEVSPIFCPIRRPLVYNRGDDTLHVANVNNNEDEETKSSNSSDSEDTYFSQADLFSNYEEPLLEENKHTMDDSQLSHSSIDVVQQNWHFHMPTITVGASFMSMIYWIYLPNYYNEISKTIFSRSKVPMTWSLN